MLQKNHAHLSSWENCNKSHTGCRQTKGHSVKAIENIRIFYRLCVILEYLINPWHNTVELHDAHMDALYGGSSCQTVYNSLLDKGTHLSYANLHEMYPMMNILFIVIYHLIIGHYCIGSPGPGICWDIKFLLVRTGVSIHQTLPEQQAGSILRYCRWAHTLNRNWKDQSICIYVMKKLLKSLILWPKLCIAKAPLFSKNKSIGANWDFQICWSVTGFKTYYWVKFCDLNYNSEGINIFKKRQSAPLPPSPSS